MAIKYIFFDLGDTLINMSISKKALYLGLKSVLPIKSVTDELVLKWEKESYKTFEYYYRKGEFYTVKQLQSMSLKNVLLRYDIDLPEPKLRNAVNEFWRYFIKNCQLYEDVIPILSKLIDNEYELGLITNADEENVIRVLKQHNLKNIFKTKIISSEFRSYKPDLLLFEKALELTKCLPEEAIYVGDSAVDIYGAKKLGMITVLINGIKTTQNKRLEIEPDFWIGDLQRLPEIIEKNEI